MDSLTFNLILTTIFILLPGLVLFLFIILYFFLNNFIDDPSFIYVVP